MTDVTTMSILELLGYWDWLADHSRLPFWDQVQRRHSVRDELERRIGANRVEPTCNGKGCQL